MGIYEELVVYTFAAGDDCSILLSFCGAGEKVQVVFLDKDTPNGSTVR